MFANKLVEATKCSQIKDNISMSFNFGKNVILYFTASVSGSVGWLTDCLIDVSWTL